MQFSSQNILTSASRLSKVSILLHSPGLHEATAAQDPGTPMEKPSAIRQQTNCAMELSGICKFGRGKTQYRACRRHLLQDQHQATLTLPGTSLPVLPPRLQQMQVWVCHYATEATKHLKYLDAEYGCIDLTYKYGCTA